MIWSTNLKLMTFFRWNNFCVQVIGEFEKIFGPEDDFITMPTLSQTQHICIIPSGGYNALLVTDPETKSLILLKRDGSFQRSYRYTSCLNDLLGISLEFPTGVAPSKSQNEVLF